MSGWLKAGLIGAAIAVVFNVVEVIPCVACCAVPLELVAYGCIGALAAYWIPPVRTMGAGAGQGALAAVIAAAIGGVIGIGVNLVGSAILGPMQLAAFEQLPPDVLRGMAEAGIDPNMLAGAGAGESIVGSVMCCGVVLVIAAGLGALGGLIFAAAKSE